MLGAISILLLLILLVLAPWLLWVVGGLALVVILFVRWVHWVKRREEKQTAALVRAYKRGELWRYTLTGDVIVGLGILFCILIILAALMKWW